MYVIRRLLWLPLSVATGMASVGGLAYVTHWLLPGIAGLLVFLLTLLFGLLAWIGWLESESWR